MIVQIPTIYNLDHLRDILTEDLNLYHTDGVLTSGLRRSAKDYAVVCRSAKIAKGKKDE